MKTLKKSIIFTLLGICLLLGFINKEEIIKKIPFWDTIEFSGNYVVTAEKVPEIFSL